MWNFSEKIGKKEKVVKFTRNWDEGKDFYLTFNIQHEKQPRSNRKAYSIQPELNISP